MTQPSEPRRIATLTPDCDNCCGLCCVASAFSVSADFALDKAPGEPCPNLESDFRCAIHSSLRSEGFPGCVAFDCFGAGQRVTQGTYQGQDWRKKPLIADEMFRVYGVMRHIHELLVYLEEALRLEPAASLRDELWQATQRLEDLAAQDAEQLVALDLGPERTEVNELLLRASELVRLG